MTTVIVYSEAEARRERAEGHTVRYVHPVHRPPSTPSSAGELTHVPSQEAPLEATHITQYVGGRTTVPLTTPKETPEVAERHYIEAETEDGKVIIPISKGVAQKIEKVGGWEAIQREVQLMRAREEQQRVIGEALRYAVKGKDVVMRLPEEIEYEKRQMRIVEKKRLDPTFQTVFATEKIFTGEALVKGIEWIFAPDKPKYVELQRQAWIEEQRQILYKLGTGRKAEVLLERGTPMVIAGALYLLPVKLKGVKLGKLGSGIATGIGLGLTAYGTQQVITGLPQLMKSEPSTVGSGLLMLGAGVGLTYTGWRGLFPAKPKTPKVEVKAVGKGRALHKIDTTDEAYTGVKETDIIATAGKRKFIGKSVSDYMAELEGQKLVRGYGQVETRVGEIKPPSFKERILSIFGRKPTPEISDIISQKDIFATKGLVLDQQTIYSQTVHVESAKSNIASIFHRTKEGKSLVKSGIQLVLRSVERAKLKGFETLTRIKEWYHTYPSKTMSIMAGEKFKGADITDISYIIPEQPSEIGFKIFRPSLKLDQKIIGGVAEAGTELGKQTATKIVKDIISTPSPKVITGITPVVIQTTEQTTRTGLKSDVIAITQAKQISETALALKKDIRKAVTPREKTELGLRLDTRYGLMAGERPLLATTQAVRQATRLDTRLALRLDTRVATRVSPISTPIIIPFTPSPTVIILPPVRSFYYTPKLRRFRLFGRGKRRKGRKAVLPTADLLSIHESIGKFGRASFVRSQKGIKEFRSRMKRSGVFMRFPTAEQYGFKKRKKRRKIKRR